MDPIKAFRKWLASPTTLYYTYHKGFLLMDRGRSLSLDGFQFYIENTAVDSLANVVWLASQEGSVFLMQKRIGPGSYEYRAYQRRRA